MDLNKLFERGLEATTRAVKPIADVEQARQDNINQKSAAHGDFVSEDIQRINGDRGDTSVRDLGIGMGVTFGPVGLGVLAVDTIVNANFESIGYGSLAIGLFGAAVALREIKSDLISRD